MKLLQQISFAAICTASVFAVDGVILIDQRAVMAGKITPGDTPGFPVTISQPGSYRLAGNLTVPDAGTTAIHITADDVSLDLNGFALIGPNTCSGTPVQCTYSGAAGIGVMAVAPVGVVSPANVRVINGVVRGMGGHGIRIMGDGTVVERVHSLMNGGPGIVVGAGSVIDSVARYNASGTAVVGLIVRGTTASNNVFGIFIRQGGVGTGNSAYNNSLGGISVNYATATDNSATYNGSYGIQATCPSALTGNTAYQNAGGNITTNGSCALLNNAQ